MAHHISEATEYFPHLESRDLHVVQEFKALIQDHLYSGARDHSFQNALVDYYIRTNSQHAMDILCKVREPLDKPLLDKLNDSMKMGAKLQSLTLLSHIVRRQPTWLYKIVQTNLFASLLQCLKTTDDCSVIMCGLLTITTLLPMIPSLIGPSLKDIFEIFTRFAEWNLQRPGHVPDVYHLHLHAAVYALFHRLYGMFPWNFLEFLRSHYAGKSIEFNANILPMFERVRLHPQLILGSDKFETEAARWRKMEVHDVLTECSRVSLDVTECTRDSLSLYNMSASSDSGRVSSSTTNLISQSRKTSSPFDTIRTSDELKQRQSLHQKHKVAASATGPADLTTVLWSPSVLCGLATPPSSRPGSPGSSLLDASFNSSIQLISTTNTPTPFTTPLTTPRDSPHNVHLVDDSSVSVATEGTPTSNVGRSNSASKVKSKVPPSLKNLPHAHKTVSAPSTPGYAERKSVPPSPARKHSGAGIAKCFNFETEGERGKLQTKSMQTRAQRSREASGESSEGQRSEEEDLKSSSVSMKDLPDVIEGLAGNRLATSHEDEQEINSEVSALVTTSSNNLVEGTEPHKQFRDMSEVRSKGTPPKGDAGNNLPFKVDFMLSEIPCEVLRGKLLQKKKELLAEAVMLGDVDEDEITEKLQSFCSEMMNTDNGGDAQSTDAEKSQPIPVPHSQGKSHCEVCSSSGKSIEVVQVTESHTLDGGFTPIRDQSVEISKGPGGTTSEPGTYSIGSQVAAADTFSYAHLLPYALTQSWPTHKDGMMEMSMDLSQTSTAMSTPMTGSRASSVMGGAMSSLIHFSPNELLDRHIQLGDSVHTKELSMLPLTSQMSVNWTHFGGAAPVDEVNILKSQVIFLHNQVLYERHKREVHAERNRRLLGKTHKAKACQELNIAMKDQMKLQENRIEELKTRVDLVRKENILLEQELAKKEGHYVEMVRKLEKDNKEFRECNQVLQKLLVEHKGEVDQAKQNVQSISSELFSARKELENAQLELATTKRLKDEITWLNKELLLIGEVNQKLKEKVAEDQLGVRTSEEQVLVGNTMKKELRALKDTFSEKMVQLNAAKTRITELEASLTNKDVAISEQKRFLETVKSLSKGRIEAVESKYHSQKKINQRLESTILKLTKQLQELTGKDIFKPRQYQRTNSEQIADSLRQNEGTGGGAELARGANLRASWHYPEWRSRQSTPTKSRNPSGSSVSPVESVNQSPESSVESSPGPHQKTEEGTEDLNSNFGKQQDKKENSLHASVNTSVSSEVERVSSASRINFSQSSPFQRVHSSHSDPSGTGNRHTMKQPLDGEESKSWSPSGGNGLQVERTQENGGSGTPSPQVVNMKMSKVGLGENQTSRGEEDSMASGVSVNVRREVQKDKEG